MSTELPKTTITDTDDHRRAVTGLTKGIPMRKTLTKLTVVAMMTATPLGLSSAVANAAPTAVASTQANPEESNALRTENAAAEGDMRIGSFSGQWCGGFQVRYDVTDRIGDSWEFYGRLAIADQYDNIRIIQYADNSLAIVRYLTGDYQGQVQTLRTTSPQHVFRNGVLFSKFQGRGSGPGCSDFGDLWIPER
jgi:hypothetical protein